MRPESFSVFDTANISIDIMYAMNPAARISIKVTVYRAILMPFPG